MTILQNPSGRNPPGTFTEEIIKVSTGRVIHHIVAREEEGTRLDIMVAALAPGLTRSQVKRLADEGHIQVDGKRGRAGGRLRPGQRLEVCLPLPTQSRVFPEAIPINII